ncbi:MAG: hypothetical protein WCG27_00865, partial [Pseudomonadota bacterium]
MLNRFLVMLITWQLSLSPLSSMAATCSYDNDPNLTAAQKACTGASSEWNCELNRCMTKEEVTKMRADYSACEGMTDEPARKACHDNVAKTYAGDLKNTGSPVYSWMARFAYGASITLALVALVGSKPTDGPKCTSRTIFMIAAAAALATEIYLYFATKNKLKKIQEDYDKKALDTKSYNAQAQAFEYLIQEQETIEKVSKQRKTFYMITGAAFAVAALVAALEASGVGSSLGFKACTGTDKVDLEGAKPAVPPTTNFYQNYQKAKDRLFAGLKYGASCLIPSAYAKAED